MYVMRADRRPFQDNVKHDCFCLHHPFLRVQDPSSHEGWSSEMPTAPPLPPARPPVPPPVRNVFHVFHDGSSFVTRERHDRLRQFNITFSRR